MPIAEDLMTLEQLSWRFGRTRRWNLFLLGTFAAAAGMLALLVSAA
jgi:hypothetical protein